MKDYPEDSLKALSNVRGLEGNGYLKQRLMFQQDERKEVGWNSQRRLLEVKTGSLCQQKG